MNLTKQLVNVTLCLPSSLFSVQHWNLEIRLGDKASKLQKIVQLSGENYGEQVNISLLHNSFCINQLAPY